MTPGRRNCSLGKYLISLLAFVAAARGLAISGGQQEQVINDANILKDSNFNEIQQNTRDARFINFKSFVSRQTNEIEEEPIAKEDEPPSPITALTGMYSDCITEFSFSCVQRKILVFFDRLGRMERFNLLDNFISVIRTRKVNAPPITEENLRARGNLDSEMDTLMDLVANRFFNTHILRIQLPTWTAASVPSDYSREARTGTTVDISFPMEEEGNIFKFVLILVVQK